MNTTTTNCRICLDPIPKKKIIKPCNCTEGTYHLKCLETFINTRTDYLNMCEICLFPYHSIKIIENKLIKKEMIINFILIASFILFINTFFVIVVVNKNIFFIIYLLLIYFIFLYAIFYILKNNCTNKNKKYIVKKCKISRNRIIPINSNE